MTTSLYCLFVGILVITCICNQFSDENRISKPLTHRQKQRAIKRSIKHDQKLASIKEKQQQQSNLKLQKIKNESSVDEGMGLRFTTF